MKNALVCIAKDEDNYLDEWLRYHLKLGFDEIFVYQNDWRYGKPVPPGVTMLEMDGEARQLPAYNDFIDGRSGGFGYAAFWDCDEYLCLKKDRNVAEFFARYSGVPAVGINWRCFGDSGMAGVADGNYSLVTRFLKCESCLNKHIKTAVNLAMVGNSFHFVNPHFVDAAWANDVTADVSLRHWIRGPFNDADKESDVAQLNHYNSKTWEEFQVKFRRGKADTPTSHPAYMYTEENFRRHNKNDVEDTTARDFFVGAP